MEYIADHGHEESGSSVLIQEARNRTALPLSRQYEQALVDGDGLRFCKIDAFRPDDGCAMSG